MILSGGRMPLKPCDYSDLYAVYFFSVARTAPGAAVSSLKYLTIREAMEKYPSR